MIIKLILELFGELCDGFRIVKVKGHIITSCYCINYPVTMRLVPYISLKLVPEYLAGDEWPFIKFTPHSNISLKVFNDLQIYSQIHAYIVKLEDVILLSSKGHFPTHLVKDLPCNYLIYSITTIIVDGRMGGMTIIL